MTIPLEQYVDGCVAAELGPTRLDGPARSTLLEVQAMLCRTYAVANLGRHAAQGFDLCSTVHCQLYRSPAAGVDRASAVRGAGPVIVYDGRPIQALFHSDCGGRTSAAEDVWGGRSLPYLSSVVDRWCATSLPDWTFSTRPDRLGDALGRDPKNRAAGDVLGVDVLQRDAAGRAIRVVVVTKAGTRSMRGEDFRAAMTQAFGPRALRSTRFDVRQQDGLFTFRGRGFGHGVGLCQAGAIELAREGESAETIIGHYFPGARVTRLTPSMIAADRSPASF